MWRKRTGVSKMGFCLAIALLSLASPTTKANQAPATPTRNVPAIETGAYHVTVNAPGHPPVRLYAEEAGDGEPLLLLHGLGASGYSFRKIAPKLSRHYRVISLDLKGHGRSEKPFDTSYSAHDQAVLVYWFLRQMGLKRVNLAGHSFGGQVALTLAVILRRYDRTRLKSLILLNAPLLPQQATPVIRALRKPVLPYVALTLIPKEVPIALALMTEAVGVKNMVTDEEIAMYSQPYADAGARHALIQTARQIVPPNADQLIAHYRHVHKPTLLIYCRQDQAVPLTTGRRMRRLLPKARLRILERCDHIPMEQRARATERAMHKFLH